MKTLKPSTVVNAVILRVKDSDEVIMSCDLKMPFSDYNRLANGKTQSMYDFEYTLQNSIQSQGYTFNWYVYKDDKVLAQFIELV